MYIIYIYIYIYIYRICYHGYYITVLYFDTITRGWVEWIDGWIK